MTESDSSGPSSPRKGDECKSSYRKSNKPLMEKRRRARINSCLGQLKTLVLQAMKKDNAQYSKLEKADILELTVKHLRNVQRQQMAVAMATSPDVITKYRAGFNECASEVMRYLSSVPGIGDDMRTRMLGHLANCLQTLNSQPMDIAMQQQLHQALHPQHPAFPGAACIGNPSAFQTTTKDATSSQKQGGVHMNPHCLTAPVQFIPGTLPTGQVAFVLTSPSPVQAVPLYATPSSEKKESYVKQEVLSPRLFEKPLSRSPVSHPSSPPCAPPKSPPLRPQVPPVGNRGPMDESVWRPW